MEESGEPKADILVLIEVTMNSCLILLSQRSGLVSKGSGVDDPMAHGGLYRCRMLPIPAPVDTRQKVSTSHGADVLVRCGSTMALPVTLGQTKYCGS